MPFFNEQFLKCDILPVSNDPMSEVDLVCVGIVRNQGTFARIVISCRGRRILHKIEMRMQVRL